MESNNLQIEVIFLPRHCHLKTKNNHNHANHLYKRARKIILINCKVVNLKKVAEEQIQMYLTFQMIVALEQRAAKEQLVDVLQLVAILQLVVVLELLVDLIINNKKCMQNKNNTMNNTYPLKEHHLKTVKNAHKLFNLEAI